MLGTILPWARNPTWWTNAIRQDHRRRWWCFQHLFLRDRSRKTRTKIRVPGLRAHRHRWGQNRNLQTVIPPRIIDLRKRRRRQQLRQRTLHHRKRDRRPVFGQNQKISRQLYRSLRIHGVQLSRRRNRIRIRISPFRKTFSGLRKEIQIGIHRVPFPLSVNCRRWTIQLHPLHPLPVRTHRCGRHPGQWSHLRHLQKTIGHRETHLHQFEQTHRPSDFIPHRLIEIRRSLERGHHRILNQLGALPPYPLYVVLILPNYLCWKSLPRIIVSSRDHQLRLRASLNDGQMWPQTW